MPVNGFGHVDEATRQQLREGLDALHVAIGNARLYGPTHRETVAAITRSLNLMASLLSGYGVLELLSSPEGLYWQNSLIRPEDEEFGGLGRKLHREGIASIAFAQGVNLEELSRLMGVLRINFELPEYEEETLESLLWQADFAHIGFQAVASLMEAEALSGQLTSQQATEMTQQQLASVVGQIVEKQISGGPRNLANVTEDALHRAVADSRLAGLAAGDETRFEDDQRWRESFVQEGGEDADEIWAMRAIIEHEGPAETAARLVDVLNRSLVANRHELPPQVATKLARQGVEEIYRRKDPVALLRLLDEGTALLEEPELRASPAAAAVREFYANAVSARAIARLLVGADVDSGQQESVRRLVERLPDSVLQSILMQSTQDPGDERGRAMAQMLGEAVGDRIDAWLLSALNQPAEQVTPTIALARSLGRERATTARAALLKHRSALVRVEVLGWYGELFDEGDEAAVLPALFDGDRNVRRAAADALVAHRPYEAIKRLRGVVSAADFSRRGKAEKIDLCITFGLLAKDSSVAVFEPVLQRKKEGGTWADDVEAAARGLAAAGSVGAKQALKRNAGGLFGPKKAIVADAMKRLEAGRAW